MRYFRLRQASPRNEWFYERCRSIYISTLGNYSTFEGPRVENGRARCTFNGTIRGTELLIKRTL